MTPTKSPTLGQVARPGTEGDVIQCQTALVEAVTRPLVVASASLGSAGSGLHDHALDEVARWLRRIEGLLGELADDAGTNAARARQLRSLRDEVSVHLSAAASLRLLDLDANAAVVLRRAVASVRAPTASFGHPPHGLPVHEAGR